jgi:YaiO family outer membrane protein
VPARVRIAARRARSIIMSLLLSTLRLQPALAQTVPVQPAANTATAVAPPPATPYTLEVEGFYQVLDHGYTDWQGLDLRLSYSSPRVSPFLGISTQRRGSANQENFGVGSYITIDSKTYAIVGISAAPGGNAVLNPRLRWDVSLLTDSRVVPGLVVALGYTHLSFGGASTGQIGSLGAIYYHGPLIVSGGLHLNHDGVGGANSGSAEIGAQYGSQGRYWVGGRLAGGHEAYEILADRPFDVRYTDVGGSVFYQRWMTARTALIVRLDYEQKLTAYHRGGLALTYQVTF